MIKAKEHGRARCYLVGLLGAIVLALSGCNGTEDSDSNESVIGSVPVPEGNSPATIASESDANYDNNTYGLITGDTLASWINNWTANRPAGISGKLIILQTDDGEGVITPNNTDVFTYVVGSSEWVETRSNGVVVTKSMVPSGQVMDAFLEKYNIDPNNDMVVCAMGTGGYSQAMRAGRCWYMFRYWGMPKGRVAMLNGGNAWNGNDVNTALVVDVPGTPSTPPYTGTATVKDLPQLNFALQATLEDMLQVIPESDVNVLNDGVFIWDARSTNQYNPTGDADFQSGPVQGHPNGALQLNYTNLLDAANGYTYRSKAELESYLDGNVTADGDSFISGDAPSGVGVGNAYQDGDVIITYCETTFRAMITGFASAAILGKPTRFYDGAMTEWHSLSSKYDSNGELLLPTDSPWRTDIATRSVYIEKSVPVDPPADSSSSGYITDAYGSTANQIIIEDFAYKGVGSATSDSGTGSSGSSGGGAPVVNGCG